MDKKDNRRQRTKQYFLEAAKEIIMSEGSEHVTVRKVTDLAGYSYPSLYHYFTDLNEFMWDVRNVMIQELACSLQKKMQNVTGGIDGLKEVFRIYISHCFENPNVFKFFNFYSIRKPDGVPKDAELGPDFQSIWKETFKELVLEGKLQEKDIEIVAKTIIYAVHGMITLCFSNNGDQTEEKVYSDLENLIDYLL